MNSTNSMNSKQQTILAERRNTAMNRIEGYITATVNRSCKPWASIESAMNKANNIGIEILNKACKPIETARELMNSTEKRLVKQYHIALNQRNLANVMFKAGCRSKQYRKAAIRTAVTASKAERLYTDILKLYIEQFETYIDIQEQFESEAVIPELRKSIIDEINSRFEAGNRTREQVKAERERISREAENDIKELIQFESEAKAVLKERRYKERLNALLNGEYGFKWIITAEYCGITKDIAVNGFTANEAINVSREYVPGIPVELFQKDLINVALELCNVDENTGLSKWSNDIGKQLTEYALVNAQIDYHCKVDIINGGNNDIFRAAIMIGYTVMRNEIVWTSGNKTIWNIYMDLRKATAKLLIQDNNSSAINPDRIPVDKKLLYKIKADMDKADSEQSLYRVIADMEQDTLDIVSVAYKALIPYHNIPLYEGSVDKQYEYVSCLVETGLYDESEALGDAYKAAYKAVNDYIASMRTRFDKEVSTEYIMYDEAGNRTGKDIVALDEVIGTILEGTDKYYSKSTLYSRSEKREIRNMIKTVFDEQSKPNQRIIRLTLQGYSQRQIADMVERGLTSVNRVIQKVRLKLANMVYASESEAIRNMFNSGKMQEYKENAKREQERRKDPDWWKEYRKIQAMKKAKAKAAEKQ